MDSLDMLNVQRKAQVENSPSSEAFIIDPNGTATPIKGVYDESPITDNKDQGNVRQKKLKPRIMVDKIPEGITWGGKTLILRVRTGVIKKLMKEDIDDAGIPIMWLL